MLFNLEFSIKPEQKEERTRRNWLVLTGLLPFIISSFLYYQEDISWNTVTLGFGISMALTGLLVVLAYKNNVTTILSSLLVLIIPCFTFEAVKLYKELLLEQDPHGILQAILFGWWLILSYRMVLRKKLRSEIRMESIRN